MKIVLRYIASTQKNYLSSVTKYFYFVTLHLCRLVTFNYVAIIDWYLKLTKITMCILCHSVAAYAKVVSFVMADYRSSVANW